MWAIVGTAVVQPIAQLLVVGFLVTLLNQVCAHAGRQRNSTIINFMGNPLWGSSLQFGIYEGRKENFRRLSAISNSQLYIPSLFSRANSEGHVAESIGPIVS